VKEYLFTISGDDKSKGVYISLWEGRSLTDFLPKFSIEGEMKTSFLIKLIYIAMGLRRSHARYGIALGLTFLIVEVGFFQAYQDRGEIYDE